MVSSSGISFSGLASGLDTAAIVQQLLALERIPIQQIETKRDREQEKLDKIDVLSGLVKTLQEKAEGLSESSGLLAYAVTGADPSIATIAATGAAAAGTHTLEVLQLAEIDRWAFDGVADPTVDLGTNGGDQIAFSVAGVDYTVDLEAGASSLEDIAAAFQEQVSDVVTASVVNTGTSSDPSYRLVLASNEPGAENRITDIVSRVENLTIDYQAPDGDDQATSESNITVGVNAFAKLDGLTVERGSNDFSDVYDGLEITLVGTNVGQPMSFTVDSDREAIRAGIDEFVAAYNEVIGFVNQQSTYTPAESEDEDAVGTTGVLFGDSLLKSVSAALRRSLFDVDVDDVLADTEGYSTLSLIGISVKNDGTLEVDGDVLDEKMAGDLALFADLFTDDDGFDNGGAPPNTNEYYTDQTADSGLMATLAREIDRMFGSFEGPIDPNTGERVVLDSIFDLKQDTIRATIRGYDDRISEMERRLTVTEQNLTLRFSRLEELMGALNAQGAALVNALSTT